MKSIIFIKFLFLLVLALSFCNAKSISNYINDLKERKRDIEFYLKVTDIERDITFNDKKRTLDVYYKKEEEIEELKPVVIFIYGGTWHEGDKVKFTKVGSLLKDNDYISVIPNYILFPIGGFEDMVNDIYTSIQWTYENIEKYGGDPKRIIFMKNLRKELEPLPELEKVILLSGPYDFDDYSKLKNYLGKDIENSLLEQFVKVLFRTKDVSPYDIVKAMGDNSVDDGFNVKKFILYYTSKDDKIPEISVHKLMNQMKRVSENVNIEYIYREGFTHDAITSGMRNDKQEQIDYFLYLLEL
ncbi:alpha/beta-hydrolase [Neocallimastix californiae]|uniref:Alpha/beta-hydrolase n=1 Tax=Neocallimastix californiae TaxID=1754190 RepID=A0A1Y2AS60_9FUNG|nr:alpha/beta-hydrolase [Neocallimastix californiae]|eukprot:ORY25409.1 alpha/beta-hydrolase [Neocallimastix californiae]